MRETISHDDRDPAMQAKDRFFRPLECCAAGLAGLVLWTATGSALGQAPYGRPAPSAGPAAPPALPPAPAAAAPLSAAPPAPASRAQVADVVIQGTQMM